MNLTNKKPKTTLMRRRKFKLLDGIEQRVATVFVSYEKQNGKYFGLIMSIDRSRDFACYYEHENISEIIPDLTKKMSIGYDYYIESEF
jgi:hypothetical protein